MNPTQLGQTLCVPTDAHTPNYLEERKIRMAVLLSREDVDEYDDVFASLLLVEMRRLHRMIGLIFFLSTRRFDFISE